jgi:predicted nucleic acid-binding protein
VRIFLDANILFSAAKSDGAVRELLRRLLESGHALVADGYVLAEARHNLLAKGPASLAALDALTSVLDLQRHAAGDPDRPEVARLPPKDRPVLAAAIALRCDVLLTGDRRDFAAGFGRSFAGVVVHAPRSLFDAVWPR